MTVTCPRPMPAAVARSTGTPAGPGHMPASPGDGRPGTGRQLIEGCAWSAAALLLYTAHVVAPALEQWSSGLLGLLATLLGVRIFLRHGGQAITVAGAYNLAFALFIGVVGMYLAVDGARWGFLTRLPLALLLATLSHVWTVFLCWRSGLDRPAAGAEPEGPTARGAQGPGAADTSGAALTGWVGAAGLLAAVASLPVVAPASRTLLVITGMAFSSVLLVTTSLVRPPAGRRRGRLVSPRTVVVAALLLGYVTLFHTGSGRLQVIALALGIATVCSRQLPGARVKYLVLLAAPLATAWAAHDRINAISRVSARVAEQQNGLESGIHPLWMFSRMLGMYLDGTLPLAHGLNFLAVVRALLPGSDWVPGLRPLGYILADISTPGHSFRFSDVASVYGEWLYNFGPAGLVAMVPVVGVAVRGLDALLDLAFRTGSDAAGTALRAGAVVMCTGVFDLVWVGSHTYLTRTALRLPLPVLLLLAVTVLAAGKRNRCVSSTSTSTSGPRGRTAGPARTSSPAASSSVGTPST